mgnify:CR=1 FL=1
MEWVEVRGDDVAAAEELALDQLGVAREDAEFEVVTAPENKWLGLKKTEARVRARVKPAGPRSKENNKKRITAILGQTNTGKTHLAIETMLSFESGMIGFPLRLLAREVYDKIVKKIDSSQVALITGDE